MPILIVHAHNEPPSFNAAMKNMAFEELSSQGHSVEVSDLYAMRWNPIASATDFGSRINSEHLTYALEQVVGFVQLSPVFSSISAQRTWRLNDLYALQAARGRGVGTALLNAARDFAISTGARGIVLETRRDNLGAQRLYEAHGDVQDTGLSRFETMSPAGCER